MGFIAKDGLSLLGEYSYTSNTLKLNLRYIWKLCIHVYRVSNSELTLLYALVCKGDASHIKISLIIMKTRPETNCWLWLKTENIFSKKLQIFVFFLIGFIYPKSWPTFCLMSYYNYYKGKKYAICILHTLCIPRYNFKKKIKIKITIFMSLLLFLSCFSGHFWSAFLVRFSGPLFWSSYS